jgi:mRNA interferase MazF
MPQPQRAVFPLTLELSKEELPKKSWVKISQVRTLSVERIKGKITEISEEDRSDVVKGLNEIIGR